MTSEKNRIKLEKLTSFVSKGNRLLIFMQDYPDPDAIAAAAALRQLVNHVSGVPCTLAHGGAIGRAENRALVKYAGLNLRRAEQLNASNFSMVAMVDTQPRSGNNSLPADIQPQIVIDHHPMLSTTRGITFTDIRRRYGATCTILYEYLTTAEVPIGVNLATTLVYGIRSDTQDLGREAIKPDISAYLALYPIANKRMLSRIEHATLPRNYYQIFARALDNATLYGRGILAGLGNLEYPEVLGEIADLLLRNEDSDVVLCHGVQDQRLLLSLRANDARFNAGNMMKKIVGKDGSGGGHGTLAGGQITLPANSRKRTTLEKRIATRFREQLDCESEKGEGLVSAGTAN